MPSATFIDLCDYPVLRFGISSNEEIVKRGLTDGALPAGQYAFVHRRAGSTLLVRDPLGCNKLFFGRTRGGDLVVANRVARAWRAGVPLASLTSCPPGHILEIRGKDVRKVAGRDVSELVSAGELAPGFQRDVRVRLERSFAWLREAFEGCRFVVCLSGGLDSSLIASFAAAHLPDVVAVSFTYLDDGDLRRYARGAPVGELASASADFVAATRVASSLGIPLRPVVRPQQAVATAIRASVWLCQDWRDFNVHCATVNLFLAQDIRVANPGMNVVVLTGDLMNEYVCDYREEQVGDTTYYKIPRIPKGRLRKFFVRGLDAGDREIGVFWGHGLITCQPFSVLAEHYMRIPAAMLEDAEIKWRLNGPLLPAQVAGCVSRAKTRAQVGGSDLGTLGIYHRLGVAEGELKRVWRGQFPLAAAAASDDLIELGRYRLPTYESARAISCAG